MITKFSLKDPCYASRRKEFLFFGSSCAVACEGGIVIAMPWKGIMSIHYEDATRLWECCTRLRTYV